MDPGPQGTLQNLALSIAEQGITPVSVPPLLRDLFNPVSRFDLKLHLKRTLKKMRDLLSPDLSFLPFPSSVVLPSSKAIGKKSVLSTPKRSLKQRCT